MSVERKSNKSVSETDPIGEESIDSKVESREGKINAIHEAQEAGLNKVTEQFGPEGTQEQLAYHGEAHTRGVIERASKVAEALGATEDEKELAKLAAAWHDVVQNALENPDAGNRARDRTPTNIEEPEVGNEYKSFQALESYIESETKIALSKAGKEQLKEAILATAPDFAGFGLITYEGVTDKKGNAIQAVLPDSVGPKINQPILEKHLKKNPENPSKIVLAVALADLGTVGMEKGEGALKDGDAEYQETRSAIQAIYNEYIKEPPEDKDLSVEEKAKNLQERKEFAKQRVKELLTDESGKQVGDQEVLKKLNEKEQAVALKSMRGWLNSQQGFAEAQRERFYKILKLVPDGVGENLKKVFTQFETNIQGMQKRFKAQEGKSFHEVAQEMGYQPENLPAQAA